MASKEAATTVVRGVPSARREPTKRPVMIPVLDILNCFVFAYFIRLSEMAAASVDAMNCGKAV